VWATVTLVLVRRVVVGSGVGGPAGVGDGAFRVTWTAAAEFARVWRCGGRLAEESPMLSWCGYSGVLAPVCVPSTMRTTLDDAVGGRVRRVAGTA